MKLTLTARSARLLLFLATVIWGTSFVVMKNTLALIPTFPLLVVRFLVSGGLLLAVFGRRLRGERPSLLLHGALLGLFLFLAYTAQTFGLEYTTPSKNAFLTAVYCILVPFLYALLGKGKLDRYHVSAAFLCVTGIGLVSLNEALSMGPGDGLTLAGGVFFAIHIILLAGYTHQHDIFLLTAVQFLAAGVLALVCAPFGAPLPLPLSGESILSLGYLTLLATTGALLFQSLGQKHTDPSSAALILVLEAPLGAAFSMALGAETPTLPMVFGFLLIFVALVCSETKFRFLGNNP